MTLRVMSPRPLDGAFEPTRKPRSPGNAANGRGTRRGIDSFKYVNNYLNTALLSQ